MCGICGYAGIHAPPGMLDQLNQALRHRGPDDEGLLETHGFGLAMRRLAIIDVEGGHQPISNEDGLVTIVFNGEIYNFHELRASLQSRGHVFRSRSDTETMVHLYEEKKEATPQYLKGMFAFCIYDRRDQSLFLARDRFGEKPLYYCHLGYGIIFSSEVRSLLECPMVPRRIDREALGYYLRNGIVPAPLTMLEGVKILPPGRWLRWHDGSLQEGDYFRVHYEPDDELDDERKAAEAVREALREAVRRQMMSEVPLGAFLSGGIDSSSVVAMLRSVSDRPPKTFTVRFEESAYDESKVARAVADHLGTEHHEYVVPNFTFHPDDLWRIVDHVGLPFSDTSAIPTYLLSKYISEEITVALSGDGGDEVFAGYPYFQWGLRIDQLRRVPKALLQAGARMAVKAGSLPLAGNVSGLRLVRRALDAAVSPPSQLPIALYSLFEPDELLRLVRDENVLEAATGELPRLTTLPREAENWSLLRRLMYYRLKHDLPGDMLTKVDRMSMACSLEVRAPMLDVDLVHLSMRLPEKHLIKHGAGKHILREAVRRLLPESVFSHPKSGFSLPLHRFQNAAYVETAHDLLDNNERLEGLFDKKRLSSTVETGLSRRRDKADLSVYRASHQVWALMQLAAWAGRFSVGS